MRSFVTILTLAGTLQAAPPEGAWKITLPSRTPITILVAFSQTDGKWVGDVIDTSAKLRKEPKFSDVTVNGENVHFKLNLEGDTSLGFDGIASKDGKSLKGSLSFGGDNLRLIELTPSRLKGLQDSFELAKEGLNQTEDAEAVFENAREVLRQAASKKMPADEVRAILDRVSKLAAGHGRRWERFTTLRLADLLAGQEGYADVALAQARKAERMLGDDDDAATRMATMEAIVKALTAAKKPDEAKPYQAQIAKLQAREWLDYAKDHPSFKIEEFKGRKAKSDRVVLVETFSGTEFDASAAVDAARDAILKTYKPADVIAITYHLPLNGDSDLLTAPDNLDRLKTYGEQVQRGQHALVAGKKSIGLRSETTAKDGESMFVTLRDRINEELEQPAGAKLALTVTAGKDGYQAVAKVTDLEKPGEKVMLRFALVEDRIRHLAGNGTRFHQMVVRAMPGGAAGFPLKTATAEQSVVIKPHELKAAIAKFLAEMTPGEPPATDKVTELKNLKLIAFIQNDATGDILTATMADVK